MRNNNKKSKASSTENIVVQLQQEGSCDVNCAGVNEKKILWREILHQLNNYSVMPFQASNGSYCFVCSNDGLFIDFDNWISL